MNEIITTIMNFINSETPDKIVFLICVFLNNSLDTIRELFAALMV